MNAMQGLKGFLILGLLFGADALYAEGLVAPQGSTTLVVTNVDFQNFLIDGQPDPDLMLMRGATYVFDLQAIPAFHPFFIKTVQSTGSGNTFDDGVTGNGASGENDITFQVPMSAPNLLFYNCGNHAAMTGNIFIVDNPTIFANGFE